MAGEVEGIETDEGLVLPGGKLVPSGYTSRRRRWSRRPSAHGCPGLPALLRLTDVRCPSGASKSRRWRGLGRRAARPSAPSSRATCATSRAFEWLSQEVPGFGEAVG